MKAPSLFLFLGTISRPPGAWFVAFDVEIYEHEFDAPYQHEAGQSSLDDTYYRMAFNLLASQSSF